MRVAVGYDIASEKVVIFVVDHGCGIAEEKLPFLGLPFYQADSAYARKQGTGLGLAMVKTLTSRLSGEFAIESELGVGTAVAISLPAPHLAGAPDNRRGDALAQTCTQAA